MRRAGFQDLGRPLVASQPRDRSRFGCRVQGLLACLVWRMQKPTPLDDLEIWPRFSCILCTPSSFGRLRLGVQVTN